MRRIVSASPKQAALNSVTPASAIARIDAATVLLVADDGDVAAGPPAPSSSSMARYDGSPP